MTGRLDIVQLLLHHRANPNALSPRKRTPLFYATSTRQERDRLAIIRILLEAGANVDECYADSGFNTPLMNAITLISDEDVVKELLKHGASPIAKDVTGQTAEMLANGMPIIEEILSRRAVEVNKLLASSGSSKVPNTRSSSTSAAEDGSGDDEQQVSK
jgi:ankyrin repeat protein